MILLIFGCILMPGVLETSLSNIPLYGIIVSIGAGLFWAIYLMASKIN